MEVGELNDHVLDMVLRQLVVMRARRVGRRRALAVAEHHVAADQRVRPFGFRDDLAQIVQQAGASDEGDVRP